jgi:hypothetical protein
VDAADWSIEGKDCRSWRSLTGMDGMFTRIYVVYTDSGNGTKQMAQADAGDSAAKYRLLEKMVKAQRAMTREEADALARRAADVLGGDPVERYWATIDADRPLKHRSGAERPAREISVGDTVSSLDPHTLLHVFDVAHDAQEGIVRLVMADQDLGARLDVELRLLLAQEPSAHDS